MDFLMFANSVTVAWIIIAVASVALLIFTYFLIKIILDINSKEKVIIPEEDEFCENLDLFLDTDFNYKDIDYKTKLEDLNPKQKELYTEIKNKLLSYDNVVNKVKGDAESFSVNSRVFALISLRNKKLILHINLSDKDLAEKFDPKSENYKKYNSTLLPINITKKKTVAEEIKLINNIATQLKFKKR